MSGETFGTGQLLFVLIVVVLVIIPWWRIFGKAGFSSWLSLLILVPVVNLVMLYFLAFADWPALKGRRVE